MACTLGPDILCSSINNVRIAEDAVTALIIAAIIYLVITLAYGTIKQGPLLNRLLVFALGFLPFLLWKIMGTYRRVFLDNTSELYAPLNEFGEVMEAISALFILGALVYMYLLLKPKEIK